MAEQRARSEKSGAPWSPEAEQLARELERVELRLNLMTCNFGQREHLALERRMLTWRLEAARLVEVAAP